MLSFQKIDHNLSEIMDAIEESMKEAPRIKFSLHTLGLNYESGIKKSQKAIS